MRAPRVGLVLSALSVSLLVAVSGCAGAPASSPAPTASASIGATSPEAAAFPVDVTSCGFTATLPAAPSRAVTLNQAATEVALALGVEGQLAGTAYLDDAVPEKWQAAYESVPVISEKYPDRETLLAAEPDFLYAAFGSAFTAEVAGTQEELATAGIPSLLSPFGCTDKALRAPSSFESVWDEIDSVATAFGVPERAAKVREEQQATLGQLNDQAAGKDVRIFWFDSGDKAAFAGVGSGGPQLVISAVGATNVFADIEGSWADVSWEQVLASDPDVIVLADASWSTAAAKREQLENDPVLKDLAAVKAGNFVTIPFSESTPGIRLVDGASHLAEQLTALNLS
ncbi:iron complex transport system substrate-binding protein [Tessaracoccus bendigoensis DSM 12906]|uniref:Iron complex transport system substrate-binding protein n=1 Tax=Tessaracoccus bendigoensis DSM 12906 TaxID=1123357 RepID=A0A1M6I1B0_9ACTN|nr:ABC transporter substrate-binding protein [Tessaracoccus bendigoensis]SHJ28207.1 iron complex transport system substrate-binding protein [Tessaracoccus bendigoensis DSM 12906]